MLKPIKSLLTYLQKNANGSAIFGLTNGMGPTEEPTLDEATTDGMMMSGDDLGCEDPLYDPLALDVDCENGVDDLNASNASSQDASGQIILVDVTSLKNSPVRLVEPELKCSSRDEQVEEQLSASEVREIVIGGSVNGHDESGASSTLENGHGDETKSTNLEDDSYTTASCGDTPNVTANGGIPETEQFLDVRDSSGAQPEKCPEQPPVTTESAQEHEEEEASDGSDSGLGSEPSRNLSSTALDKDMVVVELPVVPVKSNLKRRSAEDAVTEASGSEPKRPKKGITFDGVTVFYFTRMQGFGCVPSQGGCTLGMEFQHMHSRRFTLAEHAAEQRKQHRAQLQELNPRSSSSEETDSEEEPSESGSEAESESYGFLQPVTTRQRRALLKAAGVRKIDSTEKDECRVIRTSREVCGCTCRGYCDPDTCACSQAGIKCQVDRPNFPCGCTQDGCANVVGRVEFNPARVRTHFIHTIMRLNLENKANEDRQMHHSTASGYGNGSGKDWSSGPVRLPGLYGMGVNGVESVDGYHHHHQQQQQQHHMQQQQQQYGHSYLGGHAVSSAVPQGSESLDLHYAFRDYYGAGQQASDPLSMSSYYGNYSTTAGTSLDPYQHHPQTHHHALLDQRQSDPHSSYGGATTTTTSSVANTPVILDEDTTLNTPINPNFACDEHSTSLTDATNSQSSTSVPLILASATDSQATTCSSSGLDSVSQPSQDPLEATPATAATSTPSTTTTSFIDLNTPLAPSSDRLEAINDLLASSRNALNAIIKRSIIAEEDDELSDFRDPPVMPLSSIEIIDCDDDDLVTIAGDDTQKNSSVQPAEGRQLLNVTDDDKVVETSENLSEIIKNSIVETVSN